MSRRTRKPFHFKSNFQLIFILSYAGILALGILAATALTFFISRGALEQAVYSSHMDYESSREIFWGTILRVNLFLAFLSLVSGLILILSVYFYLETLFRSLAGAMERLAAGDYSSRVAQRRLWGVSQLIREFNDAAQAVEKDAQAIGAALESMRQALDSPTRDSLAQVRRLQEQIQAKIRH